MLLGGLVGRTSWSLKNTEMSEWNTCFQIRWDWQVKYRRQLETGAVGDSSWGKGVSVEVLQNGINWGGSDFKRGHISRAGSQPLGDVIRTWMMKSPGGKKKVWTWQIFEGKELWTCSQIRLEEDKVKDKVTDLREKKRKQKEWHWNSVYFPGTAEVLPRSYTHKPPSVLN